MKTTDSRAVAACHSLNPDRWRQTLDAAVDRVAARFARAEPRRTVRAFIEGLLSTVERKTCWSLAEHAGHADPQPMQRLLRAAVWDADNVCDDIRDWLIERHGHRPMILRCIDDHSVAVFTPTPRPTSPEVMLEY